MQGFFLQIVMVSTMKLLNGRKKSSIGLTFGISEKWSLVRPVEGFECQSRGRVCPVECYRVNILVTFLSHIFSIIEQTKNY